MNIIISQKHYRKTVVNKKQRYNCIPSFQNSLINNSDEVDLHDSIGITTESSEDGPASVGEYWKLLFLK